MRRALGFLLASTLAAAWACSDSPAAAPPLPAGDAGPSDDAAASDDAGASDAAADADASVDARPYHDAADAALQALMLGFWDGGRGYLRVDRDASSALTGYWIFAQALDAILDGVARTGGRYAGLVETFYLAQDAIGWTRDYFDDESWMALALIRAFDLTGDAKYLSRAEQLFQDIMQNASDSTCCGSTPGGLWWDRPHTQKATASNAGAVVTGVRLAKRTGSATYLSFAKDVWTFWDQHMVDKTTHAVSDHIAAPSGDVVKYEFTYNEGIMIGAGLALFEATGDHAYLDEAHAIAGYMVASETSSHVLFDGDEASCTGDCPQFKGIGYRYLAALHAADPKPAYAEVLGDSQKSIVSIARDPATGNFGIDWTKPPGKLVVEASSSAAAALSIFASSVGPYTTPKDATTFEAEEAVLHHVGLEARFGAFGGWGYVAGWSADGQWVDFHVKATPGDYVLTFRYAAGTGDASRLVYMNGQDVVANQAFASTGAWDVYATVAVPVTLAGDDTISLVYDGSKGSHEYLNLDRLTITKK